jgi:hypothetical protein
LAFSDGNSISVSAVSGATSYRFGYYRSSSDYNTVAPTYGRPIILCDWSTSTSCTIPKIPLDGSSSITITLGVFVMDADNNVVVATRTILLSPNPVIISQTPDQAINNLITSTVTNNKDALSQANVVSSLIDRTNPSTTQINAANTVLNQISSTFQQSTTTVDSQTLLSTAQVVQPITQITEKLDPAAVSSLTRTIVSQFNSISSSSTPSQPIASRISDASSVLNVAANLIQSITRTTTTTTTTTRSDILSLKSLAQEVVVQAIYNEVQSSDSTIQTLTTSISTTKAARYDPTSNNIVFPSSSSEGASVQLTDLKNELNGKADTTSLIPTVTTWSENPVSSLSSETLLSKVVSVTIADSTGTLQRTTFTNSPVTLSFSSSSRNERTVCKFFDTTTSTWKTDGCFTVATNTGYDCKCYHLTDFALGVDDSKVDNMGFFARVKIVYVIIALAVLAVAFIFWARSKDASHNALVMPSVNDSEIQEIANKKPTLSTKSGLTAGRILLTACDPVAMFSRKEEDFSHSSKGLLYFMRLFGFMLISAIILKIIDAGKSYGVGHIILALALSLIIMTPFSYGYATLLKPTIIRNVKRRVTNDNTSSLYWAGVGLIVLTVVGSIVGTLVLANLGTNSMNVALIIAFWVAFGLDAAITQGIKAFAVKN